MRTITYVPVVMGVVGLISVTTSVINFICMVYVRNNNHLDYILISKPHIHDVNGAVELKGGGVVKSTVH